MTKVVFLLLTIVFSQANAGELENIQKCLDKMKELCGNDMQKCVDEKWKQLSPVCKDFHDRGVKDGLGAMVKHFPPPIQKCLAKVQKMCQFNSKLAEKDMKKASDEYQDCIEKKTANLTSPECKEFAEASKQALEDQMKKDKPSTVEIPNSKKSKP